jgi:hypothetical protein
MTSTPKRPQVQKSAYKQSVPPKPTESDPSDLSQLARTDPAAMFESCLRYSQTHYQDYTCVFTKEERIKGDLRPPQTIEVKFLTEPFSVAMEWLNNAPAGDVAIYVEGKNENKMLVRPKGVLKLLVPCARIDPTGSQVMSYTLHPITDFGFSRNVQTIININRQAKEAGELKLEYAGTHTVEETARPAILINRRLPNTDRYPAVLTRFYIDTEYRIPVKIEAFDENENLLFRYFYQDIQINVGLTQNDFTPKANGITCP